MSDPILVILKDLPLSRTEREVVKRFEGDPKGRAFLPVADILRSHRYFDESLELLVQGLERHPNFTVARVVLARELMQKGLVTEAAYTIEDSPVPLRDNVLAQKLKFKINILSGDEAGSRNTLKHLTLNNMLDQEVKRLSDLLDVSGFSALRKRLIEEYEERGLTPILPEGAPPLGLGEGDVFSEVAAKASGETSSLDSDVAGFRVLGLSEIFGARASDDDEAPGEVFGVELDSTTLADIYARQGHYGKALAIYRRMASAMPANDYVRRKVAELMRLERSQREADVTVDPALVDRMETVEILDRKIKFLTGLLNRLG